MFTTIKAYRWLIISLAFSALLITSIVLYYRLVAVQTENKDLAEKLGTVEANYTAYKANVDVAMENIAKLREDLSLVDSETQALKQRIGKLPKPAKKGANSQDIEQKANELSNDIFSRFNK